MIIIVIDQPILPLLLFELFRFFLLNLQLSDLLDMLPLECVIHKFIDVIRRQRANTEAELSISDMSGQRVLLLEQARIIQLRDVIDTPAMLGKRICPLENHLRINLFNVTQVTELLIVQRAIVALVQIAEDLIDVTCRQLNFHVV